MTGNPQKTPRSIDARRLKQATGKSIALQFLKLMVDAGHLQEELAWYGLDWSGQLPEFFDIYFGEGMDTVIGDTVIGVRLGIRD